MPRTGKPSRLLIVLPSWVGDAVMAVPALRRIRRNKPGIFIGALARPGIDRLLEGISDGARSPGPHDVFDEFHTDRASGVFGPKRVAAALRPRQYDTALLLTGSFSTALVARIAGIPTRIGYDRDGRGFLLTHRLDVPRPQNPAGAKHRYAIVPAVTYYWHAASALLSAAHDRTAAVTEPFRPPALDRADRVETLLPPHETLSLHVTQTDREEAAAVRAAAGLSASQPLAILNPGGNNHAKRWPAERFAAAADHLARAHGLRVLINGSPAEADLCRAIAASSALAAPIVLPDNHGTLGALKAICAAPQTRLMITNDTGPRHIAAACGCPVVSLFGPTDARWTTIPAPPLADGSPGETILLACPELPPAESANDHPQQCAITHIQIQTVLEAADRMLEAGRTERAHPGTQPGTQPNTPPKEPPSIEHDFKDQ